MPNELKADDLTSNDEVPVANPVEKPEPEVHPLTNELTDVRDRAEAEFRTLNDHLEKLRTLYGQLIEKVSPLEGRMREIEAEMDKIKPRHRELNDQLEHLRKVK